MSFVLRQRKALGVIFMAMVVAAVYLTYATFTKKFADYDEVTVETSTIGLQLPSRADVKIRGVLVGEVLATSATADGAKITLGLYPDQVKTIPSNVTASIVPKTLFGEKYVSLIVPDQPADSSIQAGETIKRTQVATEVEKVLSDLYPLLRTVEPGELNMTLNALATALEGRGDQIGENLETVNSYLTRLNPQIPALVEDLKLTAQVSDTYADVLPQIGDILHNTVTTTTTLEDREAKLNALLNDVTAFSGTAQTFLEDNGDNIIRLGDVSQAQLEVLARYSTEFPCLLGGVVNAGKRQAEAFRGFTLHIVLETLPNQPRAYNADDTPVLGDDRGPTCLHLPNPPWNQDNPVRRQPDFVDGVDSPLGKGTQRVGASYDGSAGQLGGFGVGGYAGSPQESDLIKQLLAPGLGTSAAAVPDLGGLLLGPMVRGATVSFGEPGGGQ
ncbi:MCE family protein [Nocardioides anomalus]|uniref:MCE family protein n=1 Tax=Nocardioides anomalus TaxID=2712223 RepID=A0A6G6W861_9ACTN|nr:MCE family protein [Nocardioides anomalus]QIG41399.1 MCE family protein [Nocardioides anomalus]